MPAEAKLSPYDPSEPLALHGGPKAKRTPFPSRKRHGELEKRYLAEVIDSDVLFYFIGTKVFEFQRRFAAMYARKHCIACSSGTAAVHIALGTLQLPADAFHTRAVGSVSGLGGTAAGIGTLITTFLIGYVTDRFSFQPVVITASIMPCVATVLFVTMVRAGKREDPDKVLFQF